jgi:hypothetical protein
MASPGPWKPQILRNLSPSSRTACFAQTFSSAEIILPEQPLRAICGRRGWGWFVSSLWTRKYFSAVDKLWIACSHLVEKPAPKEKGAVAGPFLLSD